MRKGLLTVKYAGLGSTTYTDLSFFISVRKCWPFSLSQLFLPSLNTEWFHPLKLTILPINLVVLIIQIFQHSNYSVLRVFDNIYLFSLIFTFLKQCTA